MQVCLRNYLNHQTIPPIQPFKRYIVRTGPYTKVKPRTIYLMAVDQLLTRTVNVMKDSLNRVTNMVRVSTITIRASCTLETGKITLKMVLGSIFIKMEPDIVGIS